MTIVSSIQTDSLDWQIQKALQQFGEWLEYQFRSVEQVPTAPNIFVLPTWLGYLIFWTAIALLLSWLVIQLLRLLSPYVAEWRSPTQARGRSDEKRMHRRSPKSWWDEAQALRQKGQLYDACLALYLGMLQQLQDNQKTTSTTILGQSSSYTDGEYRSMVANQPLTRAYRTVIDIHEDLVFGEEKASEDLFDRCQRAYQEIAHP